jgi:phosphate transport system substrate-binding protein
MSVRLISALALASAAALGAASIAMAQQARDKIRIVGSSTVYPFSIAVAESFGARTAFPTPVVESTGSGGGIRLFCAGVGAAHPDIVNASRRMRASEYERCQTNGVSAITEVRFGADGIVIGAADEGQAPLEITRTQIWLALAAQIPADETCADFIDNPHVNWSDIDPELPDRRIEVFGPPPTSGTRDAFVELALQDGAEGMACMAELAERDRNRFETLASRIREDNAWIDAGEQDNAIVQTLVNTPTAFGVFGFSFMDQNRDRLTAALVDGVEPSFDNIASGEYPISRTMFFYVKNQNAPVVPGLREYVEEFTSDDSWGEFGYLAEKGLIPMLDADRFDIGESARALTPMIQAPAE